MHFFARCVTSVVEQFQCQSSKQGWTDFVIIDHIFTSLAKIMDLSVKHSMSLANGLHNGYMFPVTHSDTLCPQTEKALPSIANQEQTLQVALMAAAPFR